MSRATSASEQRARDFASQVALVRLFALLGVCVAGYALYIEYTHQMNPGVELQFFCDKLFSWASCSKAITGPYGKVLSLWGIVAHGSTFDIPNSLIGATYYVLALVLPWQSSGALAAFFLVAGVGSLAFSCYLAYVLKFVLREFCIICVSSYVINMLIFVFAARARNTMLRASDHEKRVAESQKRK